MQSELQPSAELHIRTFNSCSVSLPIVHSRPTMNDEYAAARKCSSAAECSSRFRRPLLRWSYNRGFREAKSVHAESRMSAGFLVSIAKFSPVLCSGHNSQPKAARLKDGQSGNARVQPKRTQSKRQERSLRLAPQNYLSHPNVSN